MKVKKYICTGSRTSLFTVLEVIYHLFYLILLIYMYFHFHLTNMNTKCFKKSSVREEVERTKYSELIICPLIKYIYFRIKSKLDGKE